MTFLPSSTSAVGAAGASAFGAGSTGAGSALGGSGGGAAGFAEMVGASNEARIREIGGKTVVFFLNSPSAAFLCAGCLSISETLATALRGAAGVDVAAF